MASRIQSDKSEHQDLVVQINRILDQYDNQFSQLQAQLAAVQQANTKKT